MIIVFKVYWNENFCDKIVLFAEYNQDVTLFRLSNNETYDISSEKLLKKKCDLNCYFVGIFMSTLKNSVSYQNHVGSYLSKLFHLKKLLFVQIKINMHNLSKHVIDYKWNDILNYLCYEKRELDSAMAWLSTLGGAFSALGDYFDNCAIMAGRISMQQFKLALKIGDPQTVARCRLFYALSLIQRGHLKMAQDLIRNVHQDAVTYYITDKRLRRMCHGIWTKLQYEWNKKHKTKAKNKNSIV